MAWESSDGNMGTAGVPQPSLGILLWAQEDKTQERVLACQLTQLCHTLRKKKTQTKSIPDPNSESQHILCIGVVLLAQSHSI